MSQNNQFNQICEAWLRAALALLQSIPQLPFKGDIEVTFTSNGGYSTLPGTPKIDATSLVRSYRDQILSLPECEAVVNMVFNTPALFSTFCSNRAGQLVSEPSQQKAMIETYILTFLVTYLTVKQDIALSLPTYEYVYQKLEEYVYGSEPITTTTLIHIRNLRSEVDHAGIGNQIFLRRATYEEKKEHIKALRPPHTFPEAVLEIHHFVPATVQLSITEQQEVYEIAHAVVFALRLLKPGFIEEGMYYHDISDQPFRAHGGMGQSLFHNPLSFSGEPYILAPQDIDVITQLWPKAKKAYNKPELIIARTRFEGSYLRTTLEDMLIDFWIGLEALFLPPDYTREMAEAVALAVSNYLGRTVENRNTIYHEVITSHRLRGKVVHGKQVEVKNLKEMTNKTGDLLRRSLRSRIEE